MSRTYEEASVMSRTNNLFLSDEQAPNGDRRLATVANLDEAASILTAQGWVPADGSPTFEWSAFENGWSIRVVRA